MRVADFHFDLPDELIADRPVEPRDAARLLVYRRSGEGLVHGRVRELGEWLGEGDLLVLNDTRVLPNRLVGRRPTGGRFEALILSREGAECRGYLKPARKIHPDEVLSVDGGRLQVIPREPLGAGMFRFSLQAEEGVDAALAAVGRAPLPPYIQRSDEEDPANDRERYQTVFAREPGAVAAPTAGLHFTDRLLEELRERGVELAWVTLHVGEGTFAPIRVDEVEDHRMHHEEYVLPQETADAVSRARERGGRVLAVGTTSVRTLESRAIEGRSVEAGRGATDLFLYPGRPLQVVDGLLTNFHLPGSTLLMLVSAFIGRKTTLDLYRVAVAEKYRFYSFGDAMLLI